MKKILLLVLLSFSTLVQAQNLSAMEPGQVYTTNNLTTFNQNGSQTTGAWQNVGQWGGQLNCWAPSNPGYCGPNPYVNANGQGMINFSYGNTDLYQIVTIASALPNSGTGLRVNGYTFGFTAKNGNGWDGGAQDSLSAYVSLYGNDGNLVRHDYYDLNYKFDWTTFNFSKTFDNPYASKDLSTIRYGFVGYDTNYWAGPYGPEIYNVSFNIKYSVDPCATNVLYSPTCPGYMDALNKLFPTTSSSTNSTTVIATSPTNTVTTTITDDPTNPTVTVTSTTTASTQSASATNAISAPAAPSSERSSGSSTSNTSLGLSIISRNQQREQNIVNQAVQSAVSTAASAAAASQQEAMSVASSAVSNSTSNSIVGSFSSTGTGLRIGSGSQIGLSFQSMDFSTSAETSVTSYRNMLTDRTNPLNEYVEQKPNNNTTAAFSGPAVNANVSNNEAAGGVDLSKIAVTPNGYTDYLNLAIKDVAFYQPKEVYKNQRIVDNNRLLRQLTNDTKHNELVEMQYKK